MLFLADVQVAKPSRITRYVVLKELFSKELVVVVVVVVAIILLVSEKLKKAVAVSEEKIQERSRRRGRFSSSHFPCRKMPKPWQE